MLFDVARAEIKLIENYLLVIKACRKWPYIYSVIIKVALFENGLYNLAFDDHISFHTKVGSGYCMFLSVIGKHPSPV